MKKEGESDFDFQRREFNRRVRKFSKIQCRADKFAGCKRELRDLIEQYRLFCHGVLTVIRSDLPFELQEEVRARIRFIWKDTIAQCLDRAPEEYPGKGLI